MGKVSEADGLKAGVGVGSAAEISSELLETGELKVGVGVGSDVKGTPELPPGLTESREGSK